MTRVGSAQVGGAVLVHVETSGGRADPDALGLLSALRAAGLAPAAVLFGADTELAVTELIEYAPSRVYVVEHESFAEPVAAGRVAAAMVVIADSPSAAWLAPTATLTTEVAAMIAAQTAAGIAWGLTAVAAGDDGLVVGRLSGNDTLLADLVWDSGVAVGLFRPHAFDPEPAATGDRAAPDLVAVEVVAVEVPAYDDLGVVIRESASAAGAGPRLDAADVIVSGGRGLGDPANLSLVRELAELLGGAAGVSLPLVELGWAPRSMQVGQTGTVVAPLLYVACGISGQIQHRVGMERSGTIVAINTDPAAPIMGFCDLAVVADVTSLLPRLIDLLKGRSS